MTDPAKVSNVTIIPDGEGIEISNEDFLKTVFGPAYLKAHVCGFPEDPGALDGQDKSHLWAGGPYREKRRRLKPENNTFCALSTFGTDPEGKQRRRKHLHDATYCVVIDDVAEKVDPAKLDGLPPSWCLSTSAGSEQWGYKLTTPETDPARVEALLNGLVAAGIAEDGRDPGMRGVNRYFRLPVGSNTKARRYVNGEPFRHVLRAWHPERTYTLEEIAEQFGIDLDAVTESGAAFAPGDWEGDPLPGALSALGLFKSKLGPGRYDITCPWTHEHTGGADSGSAVLTGPDGQLAYKCHHGHCHDRRWQDFQGYAMEELDRARDTGDEVLAKPLAELLRRVALAAGWADLGRLDPFEGAEGWEPGEVRNHAAELAELKRTEPGRFNELREHWDQTGVMGARQLDALAASKRLLPFKLSKDLSLSNARRSLVSDWIDMGVMSVLYGGPNAGKSFLAMDMGQHIAAGWDWFGRPVKQGAVVYIATEAGGESETRGLAFRAHHRDKLAGVELPFAVVPTEVNLLDARGDTQTVIDTVKEVARLTGHTPVLVVIDTLARAMSGGDENSAKDMSALVAHAGRIQTATGAHVMIVHHTGKDQSKGARGHSSLKGAVETEIEVTPGKAVATKQRSRKAGQEILFQLDTVDVGYNSDGELVQSCVVVEPHIRPGEVIFEDDPRFESLKGQARDAATALRQRWEREQPDRITMDVFSRWLVEAGVVKTGVSRAHIHTLKNRLAREKIIAWSSPHIRYLSGADSRQPNRQPEGVSSTSSG